MIGLIPLSHSFSSCQVGAPCRCSVWFPVSGGEPFNLHFIYCRKRNRTTANIPTIPPSLHDEPHIALLLCLLRVILVPPPLGSYYTQRCYGLNGHWTRTLPDDRLSLACIYIPQLLPDAANISFSISRSLEVHPSLRTSASGARCCSYPLRPRQCLVR